MKKTCSIICSFLVLTLLLTGCQRNAQPADLATADITQTTWQHNNFGDDADPIRLDAESNGSWSLYHAETSDGTFGTFEYYEGENAYDLVKNSWSKEIGYSKKSLESYIDTRCTEEGIDQFLCIVVTYTSDVQDGEETLSNGESYTVHYIGVKSETNGVPMISLDGLDNNSFYHFVPVD